MRQDEMKVYKECPRVFHWFKFDPSFHKGEREMPTPNEEALARLGYTNGRKSIRKWEKLSDEELSVLKDAIISKMTRETLALNKMYLEMYDEQSLRDGMKMTHPTGEFELLEDEPKEITMDEMFDHMVEDFGGRNLKIED